MASFSSFDVDVREERREDVVVGQRRRAAQVEVELAADAPPADARPHNVGPDKGVAGGNAELPAGNTRQFRNAIERDAPRDEPIGVVGGASHQNGVRYELHPALVRPLDTLITSR